MKIAVFCPNLIGDTVMATPTFRALRGQFPDARFTAIIRPQVAPVLDGTHWFDETILFHHRSDRREQRTHAVANLLRQMRNDVAILLPNSFRAAWVAWMAGIPRRIGYVRYGRGMLLTDGLKPPRDPTGKLLPTPILEYYLALARVLGCRGGSIQLELATTPSDESAADRAWNQLGLAADERLVCLNTGGAFGPAKNWPAAYFAELARRLTRETGVAVLVLCGPAERAAAKEIARLADHPRVVSLSEQPLSLGLSKACVRRAALLITTDSGPRHFAAAFQTPVITLFGPTHIAWTRTSHPRALHLLHPVPCGPCQRPVCPERHHRCMRELTPDHVLRATLSLLGTEERTRNGKPYGSGYGTSVNGSADRARSHGDVEGGSVQRQSHLSGQEAEITSWRHG
jgi:heptosyltransferase-2